VLKQKLMKNISNAARNPGLFLFALDGPTLT